MLQPPLDQHYVVMHLGGAKRVTRACDGPQVCNIVERNSLTMVPAGTAYQWRTEGPIAFAHVYIPPSELEAIAGHEFDIEGRSSSLIEQVGCRDVLLEPLLLRMLDEINLGRSASGLLLDTLLERFCLQLARHHVSRRFGRPDRDTGLTPHRLRRTLEFMEANLSLDLGLADLASAAGTSRSNFSRAFQIATGCSPYRHLVRRRIEHAKVLLLTTKDSIDAISSHCGFKDRHHFAVMFKRSVGVVPRAYRDAR